MNLNDALPYRDRLKRKIYALGSTVWREKWNEGDDRKWLGNFQEINTDEKLEINLLFLLSKFMFFGTDELHQLLLSLYRDLYKYPIIERIRKAHNDTTDLELINKLFQEELNRTRFIGMQHPSGSPTESGPFLMRPMKQVCGISEKYFPEISTIFTKVVYETTLKSGKTKRKERQELANPSILHYVFVDDICGGGTQALRYSTKLVRDIKKQNSDCEISYFVLFGTEKGINNIRGRKLFDRVDAVYMLDETFKAFSSQSRLYENIQSESLDKDLTRKIARKYGRKLYSYPLGHADCQLLLGSTVNIPNNTLPIFWSNINGWKFLFKRFEKVTKR